jgi:hypothetical protein
MLMIIYPLKVLAEYTRLMRYVKNQSAASCRKLTKYRIPLQGEGKPYSINARFSMNRISMKTIPRFGETIIPQLFAHGNAT